MMIESLNPTDIASAAKRKSSPKIVVKIFMVSIFIEVSVSGA